MIRQVSSFRPSVTPKHNTQNKAHNPQSNKQNGSNVSFERSIILVTGDIYQRNMKLIFRNDFAWNHIYNQTKNALQVPKLAEYVKKGKEVAVFLTEGDIHKDVDSIERLTSAEWPPLFIDNSKDCEKAIDILRREIPSERNLNEVSYFDTLHLSSVET